MHIRIAHVGASLLVALVLTIGTLPNAAVAGAMYSAHAISSLVITDIDHAGGGVDITITGDVFTDPFFGEEGTGLANGSGDAMVAAVDPLALGIGDGIDQTAVVSGSTTPPGGLALSDIITDGIVTIFNDSSSDVTVSFSFEYALMADTMAMDPLEDFAFAEAIVEVFTVFTDVLFEFVESDTDFGGGLSSSGDTIFFDVVVPAFASDEVVTFVDAFGVAATIPEPTTLALLGLGMAGMGFSRKRSKQ